MDNIKDFGGDTVGNEGKLQWKNGRVVGIYNEKSMKLEIDSTIVKEVEVTACEKKNSRLFEFKVGL